MTAFSREHSPSADSRVKLRVIFAIAKGTRCVSIYLREERSNCRHFCEALFIVHDLSSQFILSITPLI